MKKCNNILLTFLLIFFIIDIQNAFSQNNIPPFSLTKINFNVVINKSTDELNRLWNPQKGFDGSIEMPFYYGSIEAGIRYLPYKEKEYYYHDFSTFYYFLGWGKDLNLPYKIKWYNGFKVGAFAMSFHDDSLNAFQKDETELSAGLNSRISIEVIKNFSLNLAAGYYAVFTHKRIELFLISAGLAYSIKTPNWLKEFLK